MASVASYRKALRRARSLEELQAILDEASQDRRIGPSAMEELIGMATGLRLKMAGGRP